MLVECPKCDGEGGYFRYPYYASTMPELVFTPCSACRGCKLLDFETELTDLGREIVKVKNERLNKNRTNDTCKN